MVVDYLVQTITSSNSPVTFNTFVIIYTLRTREFIFCSNEERIFEKILNYQITLANLTLDSQEHLVVGSKMLFLNFLF